KPQDHSLELIGPIPRTVRFFGATSNNAYILVLELNGIFEALDEENLNNCRQCLVQT
ncbi:BgTH12-00493, partial [Blumeria graminis f. sp. triticale]